MKSNILVAAGIGVIAAAAFLYFAPKVKPKKTTVIEVKQKITPAYAPPQVNFPNNASKLPEKDYLSLYGRR